MILTGANRHDVTQLLPLLEQVPAIRGYPGHPKRRFDELYADRGYDSQPHRRKLKKKIGIRPRIARRRTAHGSGLGTKRWVVERALSWLHQFKKLQIRQERSVTTYQAVTEVGCCLIYFRQLMR